MSEKPTLVDVLVPGFIEASNHIQFGAPCLKSTRIPYYVGLDWVWECLDRPRWRRDNQLTREQIIALAAFDAGVDWQRSRKRRLAMDEAVKQLWAAIREDAEVEAMVP